MLISPPESRSGEKKREYTVNNELCILMSELITFEVGDKIRPGRFDLVDRVSQPGTIFVWSGPFYGPKSMIVHGSSAQWCLFDMMQDGNFLF
jgi:hypothetical protein